MFIFAPITVPTDYTVRAIDRQEIFAGRLGRRVDTTLTLERDGQTVNVRIGRQHTFAGKPLQFSVGDRVRLSHVVKDGERILPDAVRR